MAAAQAATLFVPPDKANREKKFENWAVANVGEETHFVFAVPDDSASFTKATLVVPPDAGEDFTYDLKISVSRNNEMHGFRTHIILGLDTSTRVPFARISGFTFLWSTCWISIGGETSDPVERQTMLKWRNIGRGFSSRRRSDGSNGT